MGRYAFQIVSVLMVAALICGYLLTKQLVLFGSMALIIMGLITFYNPENGLFIVAFSMLLSPQIVTGALAYRAITVRYEDFLIAGILVSFLAKMSFDTKWKGFYKTPIDNQVIALISIFIVSTGFGIIFGNVNPVRGFFYVGKYVEYYILFWLVANLTREEKFIKLYLAAGFITCIIVSIFGYYAFNHTGRVFAPFETAGGEPASYGGYCLVMYALLLSFFLHSKSVPIRVAIVLLIIFMTPPFIRTLSRASYLGLIPLIATILIFTKRKKIYFGILIFGVIAMFPVFFPDLYQTLIHRILFTFQGHTPAGYGTYSIGKYTLTDVSPLSRIGSWNYIIYRLTNNLSAFLIGFGVTGVGFVEGQLFLCLGEIGLIGTLVFYTMLFKIFISSYRIHKNAVNEIEAGLSLGLMASLAGLVFQSLTTNSFIIVRATEPFWFLAGMVMVMEEIYPRNIEALKNISGVNNIQKNYQSLPIEKNV